MSEDRFKEVFRRLTAETPDAPRFSDLETPEAKPLPEPWLKPWMYAAAAAAAVLTVVGLFGVLGGGGPDLAAPDDGMIDYVKLEYSASVDPVCEGGEIVDNGGFNEAVIEIWGPNSDDLTLMVATFPDGSTERMMIEGDPQDKAQAWSSVDPELFLIDGHSSFREVGCRAGSSTQGLVAPPYTATGLLPLAYLGVPTEPGWWLGGIESGHVTDAEYEGEEALQVRIEHDRGMGIAKDGTEVYSSYFDASDPMNFLGTAWLGASPSLGTWRMEVALVESVEVLESSVSFSTERMPFHTEGDPNPVVTTVPQSDCPVTIPDQVFTPPDTHPATPSGHPDNVWFGKDELFTPLPVDGVYQPRKSVWWSVNFGGGVIEQEPDITVTYVLLNSPREMTITHETGTNAFTESDGDFMIAGIDPPIQGCWQVTAVYKGASLSYVYYNDSYGNPLESVVVPDVIGMTVDRARNVIRDAMYEAAFFDSADPTYIVCDQDPSAGQEANPWSVIGLRTAPEGECENLTVPALEFNARFDTYADEAGRVHYRTSCPNADVLVIAGVASADLLHKSGATWLEQVESHVNSERSVAETADDYPLLGLQGVLSIDPTVRNGDVTERVGDGGVVITRQPDFMIEATVDDSFRCPGSPFFSHGIPVAFVLADAD